MKSSLKRSLKSRQVGLVKTYHLISGTAATPADSGLDKAYISSVVDNGVGSWTLTVIEPSRLNLVIDSIVGVTAGATFNISAVSTSSVTVLAKNAAGAAFDADFYLGLIHSTLLDTTF